MNKAPYKYQMFLDKSRYQLLSMMDQCDSLENEISLIETQIREITEICKFNQMKLKRVNSTLIHDSGICSSADLRWQEGKKAGIRNTIAKIGQRILDLEETRNDMVKRLDIGLRISQQISESIRRIECHSEMIDLQNQKAEIKRNKRLEEELVELFTQRRPRQ